MILVILDFAESEDCRMGRYWRCCLLGMILILSALPLGAQNGASSDAGANGAGQPPPDSITWRIVGRVLTTRGEPLDDVAVQMEIGAKAEIRQSMTTNLQGEFQTEIKLDYARFPRLHATFVASKTGFVGGQEIVDLGYNEKSSPVYIVLREPKENPDQLSITTLIRSVGPHLRGDAGANITEEPARQEFARGCEELIDRNNAVAAIPLLKNSLGHTPNCVECRVLLSLALITAGSWSSADQQLDQALKTNDASSTRRAEPALVMGALRSWQGHINQAAGSYVHALEADPQNMLALQELGRTLIAQKNWESADQYLEKALRAGAGDDARLLRVCALLELGDVDEAAREMGRYTAGREVKELPPAARALFSDVQVRQALLSHDQVKSVIVQSPEELIKALPGLQGLEAATDQSMLEQVLQKTGENVDAFFKNFQNTVSLEKVHQERLGKDGKAKVSRDQEFHYLLLADAERPGLGIEEHRSTAEEQESELTGLHQGLMLTSGFASASSVFHPLNRSGAEFRYLGKQILDNHETHVVAFAQKPQTAKMVTRFVTDGGSALILTQGVAWIDSNSFHILRLHTALLNPLPNVRLQKQTTEIQFQQVVFNGGNTNLWLPQEVEVTVDWRGRVLRNQHRYSDFKLFNVEAKEERKALQLPK